jgi:hypothetical protein
MTEPRTEHDKLLEEIERRMAQAPDEAARAELAALRARLDSPEVRDMARDLETRPPARREPVLECHDPLLPLVLTAGGCVVATAVCLFAVFGGFKSPIASIGGWTFNLWIVAAFSGAISAALSALSFVRTFIVRCDSAGMASRVNGARWKDLRTGTMTWPEIRSMREREDHVLEVRATGGKALEIPMRVSNYAVLRQHLEVMVQLYGDATSLAPT